MHPLDSESQKTGSGLASEKSKGVSDRAQRGAPPERRAGQRAHRSLY